MSENVNFYIDSLIVETVLKDDALVKNADASGMIMPIINKIKDYVGNHIDPNDKSGSLINILGPGAVFMMFGGSKLGALVGLAMRVFNINVKEIISTIYNKIKPAIAGDKQVSSEQVDSIVQESMQEHYQPATPEEEKKAAELLKSESFSSLMKDAKLLKLAMNAPIIKNAEWFGSRKASTANILTRILGWIFKVILASAGLMVAGDVVNKFVGRPNALDNTIQKGKPVEQSAPTPKSVSKQTKYKVKSSYGNEKYNIGDATWSERVNNDESSIDNLLVNFSKDVYDGLDGKENLIKTSPAFDEVKDRIVWYNHTSPNSPMVWIPKYFSTKKQIVDYFIDDVANKDK